MSQVTGIVNKLSTEIGIPIQYTLELGQERVLLNSHIGNIISLQYSGKIQCIQCQRQTTKSFQQGYCYPCYRRLMECNLCIIHPEKCNFPAKPCPDDWAHAHCKKPHIVYLANSSGLKVGITRESQIPTRWIDQGAIQAIPLYKVENRHHSGLFEVMLKQYVADKTNWRQMLNSNVQILDMIALKTEVMKKAHEELSKLTSQINTKLLDESPTTLSYPILDYPKKLTTLTFDKTPTISGKLIGIKGQYLLFEQGVLNIRKHSGYIISFLN